MTVNKTPWTTHFFWSLLCLMSVGISWGIGYRQGGESAAEFYKWWDNRPAAVEEHYHQYLQQKTREAAEEQPGSTPQVVPQRKSVPRRPDLEVRYDGGSRSGSQRQQKAAPPADWRVSAYPPQQFSQTIRHRSESDRGWVEMERRQAAGKQMDNQFMHQLNTINSSNMPEATRDAEHQMLWDRYTQERFGR